MKSPAFQFYPSDWLSSLRVQMMSLEEEGGYIRLLAFCWQHGSIPSDPEKVARLIGKGGSTTLATTLLTMFQPGATPGTMIHERLESEKAKQAAWKAKSAEGGRKSAEKRKGGSTTVGRVVAKCLQPNVNSSSSSSSLEQKDISSPNGDSPRRAGGSAAFEEFWAGVPHKIGIAAARKAFPDALKKAGSVEVLLDGLKRHEAQRQKKTPTPSPIHPATFLRGERWQDDYTTEISPKLGVYVAKPQKPLPPMPADFPEWFAATIMHADRLTPDQIAEKWEDKYFRNKYKEGRKIA